MPVKDTTVNGLRVLKGLDGLPGLYDIDEASRNAFLESRKKDLKPYEYTPQYNIAASNMYINQKFRERFGEDAFNATKGNGYKGVLYRKKLLDDQLVLDLAEENFGDSPEFNDLSSGLDIQGWKDLLRSDYMGSKARAEKLGEERELYAKRAKNISEMNKFRPDDFASAQESSLLSTPEVLDRGRQEKDANIQKKIFSEVQERREQEVEPLQESIYSSMIGSDNSGKKTLAAQLEEFDKLANNPLVSPHYVTFKDGKWLKGYTAEDKLQDYAKYKALASTYGEQTAIDYLDRTIQNRVAKAQDGEWTGNTFKKLATTMWSDFGSNLAIYSHALESAERKGIWNQGKNPDRPIYNAQGEIVDYEDNEDIWNNPEYWSNVYKYNAFQPATIKAIKERGGISEDVNIRPYGHTPDFISWETAQESYAQLGHIAESIAESALLGGVGKVVGTAAKVGMKAAGATAKTMAKASKVGNITNDVFVIGSTGMTGAQQEAMGQFEENMQASRERIEQQIKQELRDYYDNIDYDTPDAKATINEYYQDLKRADQRRVTMSRNDGVQTFPQPDEALLAQAKEKYTNRLLEDEQSRLREVHKKDELEAAKDASKAYMANFALDWVKSFPLDAAIQKYKFNKGSLTGVFDNTVDKNIVEDIATGGVKRRTVGKGLFKSGSKEGKPFSYASAGNITKETVKLFGAGFADEYLDGINASFAEGMNSNMFNNYIDRTYNPESYNEAVDNVFGNILSGIYSGMEGLTDRENIYEGFIGMLSPGVTVAVNPQAILHPKDTWKAVMGANGNKSNLNVAEKLSKVLFNPVLNKYDELRGNERALDEAIKNINEVVSKNKESLESASQLIHSLNSYSSPVIQSRYKLNAGEGEEEKDTYSPSMLDYKDNKLENAFTLIHTLNGIEAMGGQNSPLYQKAMHTIEGLADNSLTEEELNEEIDSFLADEDNKSILEKNPEESRQIAAERLQKNAQYFMDMKDKTEEIINSLAKNPALKNVDPRIKTIIAHNFVAKDDYKDRLKSLENDLGVADTNTDNLYTPDMGLRYGTKKAAQDALDARDRVVKSLETKADKVSADIKKAEDTVNTLGEDLNVSRTSEERKNVEKQIKEQNTLIDSYKLQLSSIKEQTDNIVNEKSLIEEALNTNEKKVFTEDDILNADARDRAWILNPTHAKFYNKAQQKVINQTRRNLLQKDQMALGKVQDASILAERISDLSALHEKIVDKNKLVASYLDAVETLRNSVAMTESLQSDYNKHAKKINKAYKDLAKETKDGNVLSPEFSDNEAIDQKREALKAAVIETRSAVLETYMEDNPNQADLIQPYYDLSKLHEEIYASILSGDTNTQGSDLKLAAQLTFVAKMTEASNNREEAMDFIKARSEDKSNPLEQSIANDIISSVEALKSLRKAVNIEDEQSKAQREKKQQKERKEREEKAKQEEEEEVSVKSAEPAEDLSVDYKEPITLNFDEEEEPVEENTNQNKSVTLQPEEEMQGVTTAEINIGQANEGDIPVTTIKTVTGENTDMVVSPTITEQLAKDNATVVDSNQIAEYTNNTGEDTIISNLSGVGMWEVDWNALRREHALSHRKGKTDDDGLSKYMSWMSNAGISLHNIIDDELSALIENNPHLKLKFMRVVPRDNATHDNSMDNHLFLVIDYTDAVKRIHNEENGGVISCQGKQYLIVGTAGYGNAQKNTPVFDMWKTLMDAYSGKIRREKVVNWSRKPENMSERFYVEPDLQTEIIPDSITPGYLVRKGLNDSKEGKRTLTELLNGKERNPHNWQLKDVTLGIVTNGGLVLSNDKVESDKILGKGTIASHVGNAFVLVPAGNGKYVPAYIDPLTYGSPRFNEDSALGRKIQNLLSQICSPSYDERLAAIKELVQIFVLDDDNNILIGSRNSNSLDLNEAGRFITKSNNQLKIKVNGQEVRKFDLDGEFNPSEFINAVKEILNPRINITHRGIQNQDYVKELDEAGAFTTDLAKFGTAGITYDIHGIDKNGNMIVPEAHPDTGSSSNNHQTRRQILYKGDYSYSYDTDLDEFFKNGVPVDENDPAMPKLLIMKEIVVNSLSPVFKDTAWKYYVLDKDGLQRVFRMGKQSDVEEIFDTLKDNILSKVENNTVQAEKEVNQQDRLNVTPKPAVREENTPTASEPATTEESFSQGSLTFKQLLNNSEYQPILEEAILNKWPDAPINSRKNLTKFLEGKGINVTNMGSTINDVLAKIHSIECK